MRYQDAKKAAKEQCLSEAAYCFQMNQQAVKLLPKIEASKAYYKQKLRPHELLNGLDGFEVMADDLLCSSRQNLVWRSKKEIKIKIIEHLANKSSESEINENDTELNPLDLMNLSYNPNPNLPFLIATIFKCIKKLDCD